VFADPFNPCKVCICCKTGIYTCTVRKCPKPKCGEKLQTLASNGCCMECPKSCKKERKNCPKLNCPKRRYAYGETACCPSCGCVNFPSNAPPGNLLFVTVSIWKIIQNQDDHCYFSMSKLEKRPHLEKSKTKIEYTK
jgi:hypothetical protein